MRRVIASTVVAMAFLPAAAARAADLNGFVVTMQFNGHAHTVWSFPPTAPEDDGCIVSVDSGSGSQTYDYAMNQRRVYMHLVDAGGSISFQLPAGERLASQVRSMPGFRQAQASRIGNIKTVYSRSPQWTTGCVPVPQESFADTAGCGEHHVPWDMTPIDEEGRFFPEVAAYPPTHMLTQCPFYGPSVIGFPTETQTHLPLSELRDVLSRQNGKLIIHGQHRWHTEGMQGRYDLTITTTVQWKVIFIRAHPA